MANLTGGSIVWNLDVNDSKFRAGMAKAKSDFKNLGDNTSDTEKKGSKAFDVMGSGALKFAGIVGSAIAVIGGLNKAYDATVKAAFDQVVSVENASFALKAYESNASKVNDILGELVAFARSDMGTLFQRQDLFQAASALKAYGDSSDEVVDHVKILSRGVALGYTTFDELSQTLGEVISQGQLTGETFDVLARRGIKLPDSLRNAKLGADDLFKALDQALPASLLEGRANTIDGTMIRLQSRFRDLGASILGVDKDTSTFIKGGLGDRLVTGAQSIIKFFDDNKQAITDFGKTLGNLVTGAMTAFSKGVELVTPVLKFFFDAIGQDKDALDALGLGIVIAVGIVGGLVAILGGALLLAFKVVTGAIQGVINFIQNAAASFKWWWDVISTFGGNITNFFRNLPNTVANAVGNIGNTLYNAGRNVIQGFLNGAGSLLGSIGNFFLNKMPDWIREPFKKALGIHSPSKVFAGFGENITQGLVNGISSGAGDVQAAVDALATDITPTVDTSMVTGTVPSGSDSASSSPVVVHFNPSGIVARSRSEWRDIMKDGVEAINEELRARGLSSAQLGNGHLSGGTANA